MLINNIHLFNVMADFPPFLEQILPSVVSTWRRKTVLGVLSTSFYSVPSPVRGCSAFLLPPFLWLWVLEEGSLALPDKYLCFASIQNHVLVDDLCWGTGVFSATELMCYPEPCCPVRGWKLRAYLSFFEFLLPRIQQQGIVLEPVQCWVVLNSFSFNFL